MKPVEGSEKTFPADLVMLSMGFLGPDARLFNDQVKLDGRSNISTPKGQYDTNLPGVFAAGDCRRGQSLIVWGIVSLITQHTRLQTNTLTERGSSVRPPGGLILDEHLISPPCDRWYYQNLCSRCRATYQAPSQRPGSREGIDSTQSRRNRR